MVLFACTESNSSFDQRIDDEIDEYRRVQYKAASWIQIVKSNVITVIGSYNRGEMSIVIVRPGDQAISKCYGALHRKESVFLYLKLLTDNTFGNSLNRDTSVPTFRIRKGGDVCLNCDLYVRRFA